MILIWSLISFSVGLYVAFGIWAALTTQMWVMALIPVVIATLCWLAVGVRCNNMFDLKLKDAE